MGATVGIDLGTTFCAVAWISPRTGRPEIILNSLEERITPSVIQFRPDGTQLENTCGYQLWMTKLAGKYRRLQELDKRLQTGRLVQDRIR